MIIQMTVNQSISSMVIPDISQRTELKEDLDIQFCFDNNIVPEIKKYFDNMGVRTLFAWGDVDHKSLINIVKSWYIPNSSKHAIFYHNDDCHPFVSIPQDITIFKSSIDKRFQLSNELIYPVPSTVLKNVNLIDDSISFEPLIPIHKPRVSFCGYAPNYSERKPLLDILRKSNKIFRKILF